VAYVVRPVGPDRWDDLEELFGPSGAYSGCWCMRWRTSAKEFSANGNAGNKAALRRAVQAGPVGLLAYEGQTPVGWAAIAPRQDYPRVLRSRALKPKVPDEPGTAVWAMPCFFIHRGHRRQGVASALLKAAPKYAKESGASTLEAYPVDTSAAAETGRMPTAAELYTGTVGLFERAGFEVHERPATGRRVVMRRKV
jgi:GNAT superfamily N-acetyltransferase